MKLIGYYVLAYFIHSFIAIIICGIVAAINAELGVFVGLVSFFSIFFTAYRTAKKCVQESSEKKEKERTKKDNKVTIRITTSYDDDEDYDYYEQEKNQLVSPTETINIADFNIEGALLYTNKNGVKSRLSHVIPQKLKVNNNGNRGRIDYWPSYSDINTGNRYDYLKWLSEGREDPEIDLGLVFIYFYGLEWRIVKDEKDHQWIADEVIRLLSIYDNNSFQGYAKNLLTYIAFKAMKKLNPETINKIKEYALNARPYSTIAESGLVLALEDTQEVSPTMLYSKIPSFENVGRSKIPTKVGSVFFKHLDFLLKDKIGEYCNEAKIINHDVYFRTASSDISSREITGKHIQIPVKIQRKLSKAWNQAIEDLRKYSNRIDKDPKEVLFTLLPDNLKSEMDHPLQEKLDEVFQQENEVVIKFGKLAEQCGYPFKEKYTLKECTTLSEILSDNSINIEPDPSYFRKSFKYDDSVCVFKDSINKLEGPKYSTVAMLMDLGISLAHSDGEYSETESKTIEQVITDRFCSNDTSLKVRASKRLLIYKDSPPRIVGLLKKLSERLKMKELTNLGNFLFEIAYADGTFEKNEEKFMIKTFKGLGIEEFYEKIKLEYLSKEGNHLLRVQRSSTDNIGEKIPKENESKKQDLNIDFSKLKALEEETKSVQNALSEIFKEEEQVEELLPTPEEGSLNLAKDEKEFLDKILEFPKIEREQLRTLAKEHGFMLGQIIDKINNWAEEVHGDYLIFDEGDYVIEQALIRDQKESA